MSCTQKNVKKEKKFSCVSHYTPEKWQHYKMFNKCIHIHAKVLKAIPLEDTITVFNGVSKVVFKPHEGDKKIDMLSFLIYG